MIRIKKVILYLCMVALLVSNISITAFASDLNDGVNDGFDRYMGGHNIKGFNTWESTDKKSFTFANIGSFFASIGMYFKGMSNESLMDILIEHLIESGRIADAESTDEYIASHLTANEEETELYLSNDFTNALYETSVQYIEENTPWYLLKTVPYSELWAQPFATQSEYDSVQNFLKSLSADSVVYIKHPYKTNESGYGDDGSGPYVLFYEFVNTDSFVYYSGSMDLEDYAGMYEVLAYDSDWNSKTDYLSIYNIISHNTTASTHYNLRSHRIQGNGMKNSNYNVVNLFTENGREIRVYKTLDDMKSYSVGQRPYYVTEKFVNYDSTVDNSTTITQTEIDNSVTYGDVYNYITNNYDNPNGLSEDELRAILAEYLSQINNNNSGGGSGGSDNGSGSGGGLGGFLDGLGSVGNAILAILGKLMEILGSAIELVTGAITDLITIIPNSIGELLGALFPVFPEEWIKAITLSLVLGVVVGIVRMFK